MIIKMNPAVKVIISLLTIGIYEFYWSVQADRQFKSKEELSWDVGFTIFFILTAILSLGLYIVIYMIYRTLRTQYYIFNERGQGSLWLLLTIISLPIFIVGPVITWITQDYANKRQ